MDETQTIPVEEAQKQAESYAGYHSIITGIDRYWEYGGFALPDGSNSSRPAVRGKGQRALIGCRLGS